MDLTGKTALVTGGGVGIGRGIAVALAAHGADVAFTTLTHAADDVVEAIGGAGRRAVAIKLDATSSQDVDAAVTRVVDELGGLDILVNNAGSLLARVPIAEMSDDHWHRVIEVNLTSAFYCSRAAARQMTRGWGRIVNISSLAARNGGGEGAAAYAAAKAAVNTLTVGLAKELGPRGITVNAIAPGFIGDTPFHATFTAPEAQDATVAALPVRRAGTPADVAGAVVWLASDLAGFITGEVLDVNGGQWFA